MQFSTLVGQQILVLLIGQDEFFRVKLVGVEYGGLWLESQQVTNFLLRTAGLAGWEKTLVSFVPFPQMKVVHAALDQLALDEKAFGL
jgi:hypothetical protein